MKYLLIFLTIIILTNCGYNPKAEDYFMNKKEIEMAHAIEWGDTKKIKTLLDNGLDVNTIGKDNVTFLAWSFEKNNKISYEYLLKNGADPNYRTKHGTIINLSLEHPDVFYLKTALENGGNPDTPYPYDEGETPYETVLFRLLIKHDIEKIKIFINAGVNINYEVDTSKNTPLKESIGLGYYEAAYLFLQKNAIVDPYIDDIKYYMTKTRMTNIDNDIDKQKMYREKVIEFLKTKGIDIKIADDNK